jgi:hypothetical protein
LTLDFARLKNFVMHPKPNKPNDREFAKRQLNELRDEAAHLKTQDARALSLKIVTDRWQEGSAHTVEESTAKSRKRCIESFFENRSGIPGCAQFIRETWTQLGGC